MRDSAVRSSLAFPDGRSLDEHGHLSLLVDSYPRILDELLAEGG